MPKTPSITAKITLAVMAIAVAPLLTISLILLDAMRDTLEERSLAHLATVADLSARRMNELMELVTRQANHIKDQAIAEALRKSPRWNEPGGGDELAVRFTQIVKNDFLLEYVDLRDPQGRIMAASYDTRIALPMPQLAPGDRTADTAKARFVQLLTHGERTYMAFSAALPIPGGAPVQLMLLVKGDMLRLLAEEEARRETLLVYRQGGEVQALVIPARFTEIELRAALRSNPIDLALSGGERNFREILDHRGRSVLATVRYLPAWGIGLVTTIDRSTVLAPLQHKVQMIFSILFVTIGLVLLLGYRLTRPLVKLARAAQGAVDGQFRDPVKLKRTDELSTLAGSLNTLVNQLRKSNSELAGKSTELHELNQELEKRVRERSEELHCQAEQLRLITDSLPALVAYVDASLCYRFINAAYGAWFGEDPRSWQDRPLAECFTGEAFSSIKPYCEMLFSQKAPLQFNSTVVHKDRGEIPVEVHYIPHLTQSGEVIGFFTLVYDMTNRRKEEKELAMCGAIVQSSRDAIFSCTRGGEILTWNCAAERIYGYAASEAVGQQVSMLIPTELRDETRKMYRDLIRRKEGLEEVEAVRIRKDGRRIDISLSAFPVFDTTNKVVGLSIYARDLTEQKSIQNLFRVAVDTSPNAIVIVKHDWQILLFNSSAERMFGFGRDEVIGQSAYNFLNSDCVAWLKSHAQDYFSSTETIWLGTSHELSLPRKDGGVFTVEVGINAVEIRKDRCIMAVLMDVTERKKTELARARYIESLRAKSSEMEQFVYAVSHDLKTPLVTIQSFLIFLEEDIEQANIAGVKDAIERIRKAGLRMREMIDDILEVSRLGSQEIACQDFDLDEIVGSIIDEVKEGLQPEDEILIADKLPQVYADPGKLKQIFENLINNATQYGYAPGEPLCVSVGWRPADGEVQLYVRDAGPGISKINHARVFGIFQRLESSTKQGTGVGLAVVEKLAALHGGRAWVESELGQGATFWIALPTKEQASSLDSAENSPSLESGGVGGVKGGSELAL